MDLELTGKIALVTGSSAGIGFSIARELASEGATIILNGRDSDRLSQAKQHLNNALAVLADVCDPKQCQRLVREVLAAYGRLDILVCNVGSGVSASLVQETPEEWRRVLDINLLSSTQMVWAASPALIASSGNVICISSICGLGALGCPLPYAAAKAALESFVINASRPLGLKGVRINSVAPGNILFPGSTWERKLTSDYTAVNEMLRRDVALGSFGKPEDVARLVAYLSSPMAAFITGSTYVVDGGQTRS
jgi:3-oxoacyl-[acyl-carrier protein] reductase